MGQIAYLRHLPGLFAGCFGALFGLSAAAEPAIRVGTSGDYAPFSTETPAGLEGFDLDVARAWARDRGQRLEWVRFRWPALLEDLAARRFDVAMSGVTVRAERSQAGRFSVPVAESGAVLLVADPDRFPDLAAVDVPGVRVAVNAGGHLERVARSHLVRARVVALPRNAAVPEALAQGEVEAVLTDTLEAPHWVAANPGLLALPPLTRDRKAYLWRPGASRQAAELDRWLLEREADGTLAALRAHHFGSVGSATAAPLPALVAAIDERLDLMPAVAEAKRASGTPVSVPEREARVLAAAVDATRDAANAAGTPAPDAGSVRALFRAQIEAAKTIQRSALAGPAPPGPAPDLDNALRPALLRIGERIARLLVALPRGLPADLVRREVLDGLDTPGLGEAATPIAEALVTLTR